MTTFTPVHEADSVLAQLIQRKVSGSLLGAVYTSAEQSDWTGDHSYKYDRLLCFGFSSLVHV